MTGAASDVTEVLVTSLHPEDLNETRPFCDQKQQTVLVLPLGKLGDHLGCKLIGGATMTKHAGLPLVEDVKIP